MKTAVLAALFFFLIVPSLESAESGGTFRARWWSYYERGILQSEKDELAGAEEDLRKALSLRSSDQRMARTYGMHFIDYFPHRELGIVALKKGDIDGAIAELEESLRTVDSAKAVFYLNRARKIKLEQSGLKVPFPEVDIFYPSDRASVNAETVIVRGKGQGQGLVKSILINGIPFLFDRAEDTVGFAKEIRLEDGENRITVLVEDLLGKRAEKVIGVSCDRDGPSISVSEIVPDTRDGEKGVRIRGIVTDAGGIQSVNFAGKTFSAGNETHYPLDFFLPAGAERKVVIIAHDRAGNSTTAEIDLDRDTAFLKEKTWTLLAFSGSSLFSSDKEPPVLSLREKKGLLTVFVDKYYLEGEASDNRAVERILINGKEIGIARGKKLFFSKTVPLQEGDNRFLIEVFDASGNRTHTEVTLKRQTPSAFRDGSRMNITILPFDTKQTQGIYDYVVSAFVNQKRFVIIERAHLDKVLFEQKLSREKLTDPQNSVRIGRLIAAEAVVATSVREDAKSIEIVSRVIGTETSEVLDVKDVYSEDKSAQAVRDLSEGLAAKIANAFPVAEGIVIKRDGKTVYTDLGSQRVRKNAPVMFCRKGEELRHPVTGKSLGQDVVILGEGYLDDIQQDFSKGKISDRGKPHEIRVKDVVITK